MRAAILAVLLLVSGPAIADEIAYMKATTRGLEIEEWNRFLSENPLHYNTRPAIVPLTDEIKALTKRINVEVNKHRYQSDGPDDADHWKLITHGAGGDCEDYVLTKRDLLIKAGLPAGALLPTWVESADDPDGHLVLTLLTDKGDFVMDNLTDWIMPWDDARSLGKEYRYTYRLFGGTTWQEIED